MRDALIDSGDDGCRPSLARDYLGIAPRKLLWSAAFVVGVMVLVTVPYVMVVGFDKWSSNMSEAGRMMWAAYPQAPGNAGVSRSPGAPCSPTPTWPPSGAGGPSWGAVVPTAVARPPTSQVRPPLLGSIRRRYACPSCGTVGLPAWSSRGRPACPTCGGVMYLVPQRDGLDLAAAP